MPSAVMVLVFLLVGIAALVLAFIAMPARVRIKASYHPELVQPGTPQTQFEAAIKPFGDISPWIALAKPRGRKTKLQKKRSKGATLSSKQMTAAFKRAAQELKTVARHIQVDHFLLRGRIGLDDPADTGHLMGLAYAFTPALSAKWRERVDLDYEFQRPWLSGDLSVVARLRPFWLIWSGVRIAWSVVRAKD